MYEWVVVIHAVRGIELKWKDSKYLFFISGWMYNGNWTEIMPVLAQNHPCVWHNLRGRKNFMLPHNVVLCDGIQITETF